MWDNGDRVVDMSLTCQLEAFEAAGTAGVHDSAAVTGMTTR